MVRFIDAHRTVYGVEPICRVMPIAPSTYFRYKLLERDPSRALGARIGRCGPARDHPADLEREPSRVWAAEGVAADGARRAARRPVPGPAIEGGIGPLGRV